MSITFDLPDEISSKLQRSAEEAGQTVSDHVADALRRHLAARELQERYQREDIEWALSVARERK